MLIAIPSVTTYINNSRKETYVDTVKELVKGTVAKVNSGELDVYDPDTTYYIPCVCIDTENGNVQSPYGKLDNAYVVVAYDGDNYSYYFTGKDSSNIGVKDILPSDKLSKESIETGIDDAIEPTTPVGSSSKIKVLKQTDCKTLEDGTVDQSQISAAQKISNVEGLYEVADAKRYIGSNPDNYVYFNNNERWRIIGVYSDKLKIVRVTPLTSLYLETSTCTNWENCNLGRYLETTYYSALSNVAKSMIEENGEWFRGFAATGLNAQAQYESTKTKVWNGKVGLIAGYEYLAAGGPTCANNIGNDCFDVDCIKSHWLNLNHGVESWTITPNNDSSESIVYALSDMGCLLSYGLNHNFRANPVVYLKSSVKITGGTGAYSDPYTLDI